ncbi:MAG: hypothetical protein ABFQ62_01415 [Patescibacteria group bacterium]
MKISKHMLTLGAVALTAGAVVAAGAASVSARNVGTDRDEMSQKIAQRFGLDQSEVESFFEENRAQHQAERQAQFEENLTQAIADGKITEAQKQAILVKHEEVKSQRDSIRDLEPEERRAAMQEKHEEMRTWAESQGISLEDIMPKPRGGRGVSQDKSRGMGMHR